MTGVQKAGWLLVALGVLWFVALFAAAQLHRRRDVRWCRATEPATDEIRRLEQLYARPPYPKGRI